MCIALAGSLSYFAYLHFCFIWNGMTTTEFNNMRERNIIIDETSIYNNGVVNNFREVFGAKCWQWFIPIRIQTDIHDGYAFKKWVDY